MTNMKIMGAALVAATIVAGCGKNEETNAAAKPEKASKSEVAVEVSKAIEKADEAKTERQDEVLIEVDGVKLTRAALDADVEKILKSEKDRVPAAQVEYAKKMFANQVAQSFMLERVLVTKARKDGYTVTDEDIQKRGEELLKQQAGRPDAPKTVDELYNKHPLGRARAIEEFRNGIAIEKMIKAFVDKSAEGKNYTNEAKKVIGSIVSNNATVATADKDALAKITKFKAELDATPDAEKAAKFAKLAEANSACPSGKKGGDLGEFQHGQMVKEFDAVAFALPVGKISDPVKTGFGYHLIMVTGKTPAVEAKGDQPAVAEKVRASHILVKVASKQPVPSEKDVIEHLKKMGERDTVRKFIESTIRAAKITVTDEFKFLLPEPEEESAKPVDSPKK